MQDARLTQITHMVLDVDGTLTDGGIYYDCNGNELKRYHVNDGVGMLAVQKAGITLVVLTGRESPCVERRMRELGVGIIQQKVRNKAAWLQAFMEQHKLPKNALAYMGDDVNDLPAMKLAGFVACPANAATAVKAIADFRGTVCGGNGAFREFADYLLWQRGELETVLQQLYA